MKKSFAQDRSDDAIDYAASGCYASVTIIGLLEEAIGERIDQHVAGTDIKCSDLCRLGCGGYGGEIGNAAEVERYSSEAGVTVEQIVEKRHEGRSLASRGDIVGTKI